ncbi:MAG: Dyp-type peroxidase [Fimbriimonadaceae bacterium]|nr:Dyp-type peroxidase [Chitinophagales bacterium]
MEILELEDIQGYIIRGYSHMMYSRYVFLQVHDAAKAKQWISSIAEDLTTAEYIDDKTKLLDTSLNIAFTAKGLSALGMVDENVKTFSAEFREGMVTEHRKRILGDDGNSAPEHWRWGGDHNAPVHISLMVFGKDKETCMQHYEKLKKQYEGHGLAEVFFIDGQTLPFNKEHFGFRDGISQPIIKGSGRFGPQDDIINTGEFIIGYKNEYNVYPDAPLISDEQGDMNLLAADAGGSGKKDLGRNGSYLVMRQMEQDVNAFWNFMNDKTKNEDGSINELESTRLASKMVGRWPSGAPITKFPDKDPELMSDDNDFGYAKHDKDGLKCPYGSHLRRCNPRDNFEDNRIKESLHLTKKHRIMRRARLYGDPYEGSPTNTKPNGEVGLLFNCFNADISRQFELVQFTWGNSSKVKELYNDPDPIIGVRENPVDAQEQNFTIQSCPVNKTVKGLQRFITIRGGAYFFFPSITTVRYICTI